MAKYTEYVEAEQNAGREPLPMNQWRAERMHASQRERTAAAEKGFDTGPGPIADEQPPDEPPVWDDTPELLTPQPVREEQPLPELPTAGNVTFYSDNRFRVEVMQAGHRAVIGGSIATIPHRQIEFNDWHWTADMRNADHAEKARWLIHSEAFRKGEVVLVGAPRRVPQVGITTGPRTSTSARIQKIDRPAGQLSARLE